MILACDRAYHGGAVAFKRGHRRWSDLYIERGNCTSNSARRGLCP